MFQAPVAGPFPSFLGQRTQLGIIVADLDESLRFWTGTMKVGPFIVIEESLGDRKFVHRGKVSPVDMSIAYSYFGDTQVEIIVQNNSAPSPYTEFLASGGQGLHHLAFWPEDYEGACRELDRAGFEEVCSIQTADGVKNVSYYSGPKHLGAMIEIVPLTPARKEYFGVMKRLAESWDGQRPVRRYKTRAEFLASPDGQA